MRARWPVVPFARLVQQVSPFSQRAHVPDAFENLLADIRAKAAAQEEADLRLKFARPLTVPASFSLVVLLELSSLQGALETSL